jgi:hypothetical protein
MVLLSSLFIALAGLAVWSVDLRSHSVSDTIMGSLNTLLWLVAIYGAFLVRLRTRFSQ